MPEVEFGGKTSYRDTQDPDECVKYISIFAN